MKTESRAGGQMGWHPAQPLTMMYLGYLASVPCAAHWWLALEHAGARVLVQS